ncbi:hypothetical protein C8J57DRAFT_1254693 [Mycena rebaudengoi]|nr:hypothetical protein C8J57DRAFT_1254693 [Mycena rebaudengoi]
MCDHRNYGRPQRSLLPPFTPTSAILSRIPARYALYKGLSPAFSAKSTPPLASWEGGSAGPDGILQRHDFGTKKNYLAGLAPPPSHEAKGGVDLAENAGDSPLALQHIFGRYMMIMVLPKVSRRKYSTAQGLSGTNRYQVSSETPRGNG